MSTNHSLFEEKGEPKRNRAAALLLRLTARPNRLSLSLSFSLSLSLSLWLPLPETEVPFVSVVTTRLSKRLEKNVLHKPLSHLQENNLSNPFQSAYRAGYSNETVLLRIVNYILFALDNDNISVLLLLDLSAVFDTTDHQILLSRPNSVFGI